MVHAYKATCHESTQNSPFFLIFGLHPRIAVDAFLGDQVSDISNTEVSVYIYKLKNRLAFAYKTASAAAGKHSARHKALYDFMVRERGGDPVKVLHRNLLVPFHSVPVQKMKLIPLRPEGIESGDKVSRRIRMNQRVQIKQKTQIRAICAYSDRKRTFR